MNDTQSKICFQLFVNYSIDCAVSIQSRNLKTISPEKCVLMPFPDTNSQLTTKQYNLRYNTIQKTVTDTAEGGLDFIFKYL